MKNNNLQQVERLGLLAFGSSGCWEVTVDEQAAEKWLVELEGPQCYLVFQLAELATLSRAVGFLHRKTKGPKSENQELSLGQFGSFAVSLLWDNEDFPRCFLLIGQHSSSTLRITLEAEEIRMLREALEQVCQDLPGEGHE